VPLKPGTATEEMPDPVTLTPETILAAIRECVTVVKPGETLAVRCHESWTPEQIEYCQEWLNARSDGVSVLLVPGAEFAVVTA
jgi:hypothetical protein